MAVLAFSQARLRCDGPCQSRSRATSPPSRCPRPSQAEDADRCYSVVGRIDYIVGHEAFDITDDRNCTLLDPARQLFGHASFCLALTDSRVHGFLLQQWAAQGAIVTLACLTHASLGSYFDHPGRGQRSITTSPDALDSKRRLRTPVRLFAPFRDKITSSAQSLVPLRSGPAKDRACQS